jgi:hypothetical protein
MAAADVTCGAEGLEFECDGKETNGDVATLNVAGGWVKNTGSTTAFICTTYGASAITTTQPVGIGHRLIGAGKVVRLPHDCGSFRFKCNGSDESTYLQYSREELYA